MTARIVAKKLSETAASTVWLVEWIHPAMSGRDGKSYRVTTYPDSELLYLETASKRRKVVCGVATKIIPQIRAAIAGA